MLVISAIYFLIAAPVPPESYLKTAREDLAAARDAHADRYAALQFSQATALYDSAMYLWQTENRRFILFRNYSAVKWMAGKSADLSVQAMENAMHNARNALHQTGENFDSLQEKVKRISVLYGGLPLSNQFRSHFNQATLLLEEIRIARSRREFHKAGEILERAEKALTAAEDIAAARMKSYFSEYARWESLYKQAISVSAANHSPLIVVDKLAGKLMFYKDGKLRHSFDAEFGPNWLGDKNHQGDQATPEGSYRVVKKKERRQTIYYKALLLNYPNSEDLQRYRNSVSNGKIPRHVDVGGLIEIHGHGGQGFNWTNGCVALTDKEMDILYRQVSSDTPVIITGSLVPYDEWQNRVFLNRD